MARIRTPRSASREQMLESEASAPDAVAGPVPVETMIVEGQIIEVLEGFGVAHMLTPDGFLYGLNRRTPGVDFRALQVGQRVQASVTRRLHRVLQATLIA